MGCVFLEGWRYATRGPFAAGALAMPCAFLVGRSCTVVYPFLLPIPLLLLSKRFDACIRALSYSCTTASLSWRLVTLNYRRR